MTSPDMDRNADEDASSRAAPLRAQFACVVVWSTGVDTRVDKIVRLAAVRPSKGGDWDSFERLCSGANEDPALGPRLAEDFGLDVRTLDSAPGVDEAWRELREFVGERPVVTHDGPLLEAWAGALDDVVRDGRAPIAVVGLDDVASLVEPGHLTSLGSTQLIEALVESSLVPQPPAAIQPPHVLTALAELVARFRDLGPLAHALCARSWGYALDGLRGEDATAARRLRQVLDIVDRPSTWGGDAPHFADWRLVDGVLEEADVDALDEDDPLALLDPAVARVADDAEATGKLSANTEDAAPFVDDDLALLDDVFRIHLPALFAPDGARREDLYRKSQHRVAEEVARCLGSDRLLLVHAPTGTGKTLAYLLPALLWAHRYRVRVGVATYTRALQTQAMEREVPRALAALADAGVAPGFRVSVLKGREHSLCWRALRIHVPQAGDDPEVWLSWTALVLFGLRDGEGDLDRFPRRSVVRMLGAEGYRESLSTLFGQVRARSGCCSAAEDRRVCAAEAARTRAEGSHVVLTNQSFALARPEFFRRVIFDECEHLHDQALSAWSHRVSFPDMRRALERLRTPGARGASSSRRSG
ncbi:MAG: DEAD/DEAH box helicase, partial [Planctomycetota bacterium]